MRGIEARLTQLEACIGRHHARCIVYRAPESASNAEQADFLNREVGDITELDLVVRLIDFRTPPRPIELVSIREIPS
jgi:hypothetical protein